MRDADCVAFLQWALPRLRMRWAGFRKVRRQVCRRIARRLVERGLEDLDEYRRLLEAEPAEWPRLGALCRVTISRFFRDRGVFDALGRTVLPRLAADAAAAGRSSLRVWSAGCASGEEPYSLVILWACATVDDAVKVALEIVATDVDPHLLTRARQARYPAGSLREVPSEWRERVFTERGGLFQLRPSLADAVELRCQDLRRAAPAGRFDLVLCRNLAFTYYTEDLQGEVVRRLAAALRPGGVLVVGRHESLPAQAHLEPIAEAPSCFRAPPDR